jgi:HlyD family secretion protein
MISGAKLYFYLIIPLLISCKKKEKVVVRKTSIAESVYASGIVKAEKQYNIYPEVSGVLGKIYVKDGATVHKGDLIFSIEGNTAELNTENAKLGLERSEENQTRIEEFKRQTGIAFRQYQQDSLMYIRQQNLWKQVVGTKVELEERRLAAVRSKSAYLNALNQQQQAEKTLAVELETAKNNVSIAGEAEKDYKKRSEIDGKVFTVFMEEGEFVNPQTLVAVAGEADRFLLEIQVDENDIGKIKTGQQVFVTMDSHGDTVYRAVVTSVLPIMNPGTGTFTVESVFVTVPAVLYPNLSLEASILVNRKEKALVIPREYLTDDNYVLTKEAGRKKVKVGLKNYEQVEIVKGLAEGEVLYKP